MKFVFVIIAPSDCLQYFTSTTGQFISFNSRGSQLGFRVYEIQNRGMILADSSLILLILQSRFPQNFG